MGRVPGIVTGNPSARLWGDMRPSSQDDLHHGATGLVGGHAAEEALKRGHRVRALVRPTSDTRWLDQWGVETSRRRPRRPDALRAGVAGADWVFNCAAKVGDWGTARRVPPAQRRGTPLAARCRRSCQGSSGSST